MKTGFHTLLIGLALLGLCCEKQPIATNPVLPSPDIFLLREQDGVYRFTSKHKTEHKLVSLQKDRLIIPHSFRTDGNLLKYGVSGKLRSHYLEEMKNEDEYTEYFHAINPDTGESWLTTEISYAVQGTDKLVIKTTTYAKDGVPTGETMATKAYNGRMSTSRGLVQFGEEAFPFYSRSETAMGKFIFSKQGSLYLNNNGTEEILLAFQGEFDRKFGNGYFSPVLNSNATYAYFVDFGNVALFGNNQSLFRINLNQRQAQRVLLGEFIEPKLSNDDRFMLFSRNGRFDKRNIRTYDIYILSLQDNLMHHIASADQAIWYR